MLHKQTVLRLIQLAGVVSFLLFSGQTCAPANPGGNTNTGGNPDTGGDGGTGGTTETSRIVLTATSASGSWSSEVENSVGEVEPYGSVSLQVTNHLIPSVPVKYKWSIQSMKPSGSPLGELWDDQMRNRYLSSNYDLLGAACTYRAGLGGTDYSDLVSVEAHRESDGELVGSAAVKIKVKMTMSGGDTHGVDFSEVLSDEGGWWKFNLYATVNWSGPGGEPGYRVEVHTQSQSEFLNWFYLGNPPSYLTGQTMMGDNMWYGPLDGILVRKVTGTSAGISWAEYWQDGKAAPSEEWVAAKRSSFTNQLYASWAVRINAIPSWTTQPYYTP